MTRKPRAAAGAAGAAVPPPSSTTRDGFVHLTPGSRKNHYAGAEGGRPHRGTAVAGAPAGCSSFGPSAPTVKVRPPSSSSDGELLKPHTGMTIRLTPELLSRFRQPGDKPKIELVLKSAEEGGPVLIVGGVPHNMNAHRMAVGSEVHIVARTEPPGDGGRGLAGVGGERAAAAAGADEKTAEGDMTVFASLHRKLIVQQVLTETKRAEIRARNDEISRREREAKKQMVVMEDKEEMLAAAESIPVPAKKTPLPPHLQAQQETQENGGRGRRPSGAGPAAAAAGHGGDGEGRRRDPLTAWVSNCYNTDEYAGHVSDLRQFLSGIEFHHVMFRYHVQPGGALEPDRRRFCIKFKTKAGRDVAIKRSGEGLGSSCSWWNPENVAVLVKGRDEDGGGGGGGDSVNDLLAVLPHGRSVADVLEKVKTRLPRDLTPALASETRREQEDGRNDDDEDKDKQRRKKRRRKDCGDDEGVDSHHRRQKLETYRRDMLRAALGASLAEAQALGAKRGAPAAALRVAGTDENNARRVATLAAAEAAAELELEEAAAGRGQGDGGRRGEVLGGRRREDEGTKAGGLMEASGPAGGARARRRRRLLLLRSKKPGSGSGGSRLV